MATESRHTQGLGVHMPKAHSPATVNRNDKQDNIHEDAPNIAAGTVASRDSIRQIHLAKRQKRSGLRAALSKVNPTMFEALREHRRYAVAETFLRVTWLDDKGDLRTESGARPIDVSERGMAVQLPDPALLLSRVRMETANGELLGHGKIRSCKPVGTKYIVGIEFTDSLRWSAPEGPITEPIPLSPPAAEEESISQSKPSDLPCDATELSERLLWSEAVEQAPPESASIAPVREVSLSQDFGADQGFIARLPMAVKVGAPVLLVLALSSLFLGHGRTMSASSAGPIAPTVGEQGWVTEWASDEVGSRRGRQLTLYRPSANQSDYQMQFAGQIENKALGWVFRVSDTKNYYGMKIENDKHGSVLFTRFAVVHGRQRDVSQKSLPIRARADTTYAVRLEASGPRFSVYIQGEPVDLWTDSHLKTGALGFMNETEESGRTNSVRISFPDTIVR
jgi:hypothetical protein